MLTTARNLTQETFVDRGGVGESFGRGHARSVDEVASVD